MNGYSRIKVNQFRHQFRETKVFRVMTKCLGQKTTVHRVAATLWHIMPESKIFLREQ